VPTVTTPAPGPDRHTNEPRRLSVGDVLGMSCGATASYGPMRGFNCPAYPPPSETSVVQKQEHALRGFPRVVDDLGF
jgi:hypothetical protein